MRGYVLVRNFKDGCVERWVETSDRHVWERAVHHSGLLACEYLEKHVVGRHKLVLCDTGDTILACNRPMGINARTYIDQWRDLFKDKGRPDTVTMRWHERRLRHSVRWWAELFPQQQEELLLEKFVRDVQARGEAHPNVKDLKGETRVVCPFCGNHEAHDRSLFGRHQPLPPPRVMVCQPCYESRDVWRRATRNLLDDIPILQGYL